MNYGVLIIISIVSVTWTECDRLFTLLIFYLGQEVIEIFATKSSYFKELSNYIDLIMLALIMAVLYVPKRLIWNPKIFSIFDETPEDEEKRCGVKRSIAAIVIVLVWTRFLMAVSKLQRLKDYNLYVIIFFKVLRRYVKIMAWYGLYLLAFGLGFYIMFKVLHIVFSFYYILPAINC